MLTAGALFVLGGGLTAAGMLWPGLYDIGILVLIVAAIGVVVRAGDRVRILLARHPAGDPAGPAFPRGGSGGESP